MSIFRKYDIRGIINEDLTPEMFVEFGLSIGTILEGQGLVVVGRDSRTSGNIFLKSLIAGLMSTGCDVLNLGMVSTPVIYYTTLHLRDIKAGIMITASHNPPQFNGLKLCFRCNSDHIKIVPPETIQKVFDQKAYVRAGFQQLGKEEKFDAIKYYKEYLKSRFSFDHSLKVVIDVGNGACGFAVDLLRDFNHNVISLYQEPNGLFPNHEPNPILEKNLTDLSKTVVKENADIGIAFDGDGDRVGFVDNTGKMVGSAELTMIFSSHILKRFKGAEIVVDVTASRAIEDFVKKAGGKLKMVRVGYPFIQDELRKTGAPFASEYSGHYYFSENGGYDDGLYAALSMLSILGSSVQSLSELVDHCPKYVSTPEQRYYCSDKLKFQIVEKIKTAFKDNGYIVNETDGARVEFENGWMLIRASNTEPAIAIRFEADNLQNLDKIKKLVLPKIRKYLGKTKF